MAVAVDVGQGGEDMDAIRQRALDCGAVEAVVVDAKDEFAEDFCLPALRANALYMDRYPLVSALSRPLIVRHLAAAARSHGASTVSHGCTGKGNDQVRFEVGIANLAPDLKVIAPVRDYAWTREKAIAYAEEKGLPIEAEQELARTRSTRTSGVARWRPASWRTSGTRPSRTSTPTPPTRRCRATPTR